MTQVENRHAGSTAVATAYLCWIKHGHRSSRTGVPADYYYLFVVFVSEAFFGLKKASDLLVSLTKEDCRDYKPASTIDCRGIGHTARVLRRFR